MRDDVSNGTAQGLLSLGLYKYQTILADPPWQFANRTGKMAPEHKRLMRYATMSLQQIMELPVSQLAQPTCHLYLWVPNALVLEGLEVMKRWGFNYKTNLVWYKVRKDGGPDGRGVGFYFRNVTELILFGIRGRMRTLKTGRTQVNILSSRKREHSRKPDELYQIIEKCSPGPYLELFSRCQRPGWDQWGNEVGNGGGRVYPAYRGGEVEANRQLKLLESRPYVRSGTGSRRHRPDQLRGLKMSRGE